jgi:hypothetical protein
MDESIPPSAHAGNGRFLRANGEAVGGGPSAGPLQSSASQPIVSVARLPGEALEALEALGAKLQKDGADAFVKSWNELLDVIVKKSQAVATAGETVR